MKSTNSNRILSTYCNKEHLHTKYEFHQVPILRYGVIQNFNSLTSGDLKWPMNSKKISSSTQYWTHQVWHSSKLPYKQGLTQTLSWLHTGVGFSCHRNQKILEIVSIFRSKQYPHTVALWMAKMFGFVKFGLGSQNGLHPIKEPDIEGNFWREYHLLLFVHVVTWYLSSCLQISLNWYTVITGNCQWYTLKTSYSI